MGDIFSFLGDMNKEVMMIYGEAGTGKTTLALQAALDCVKKDGKVLFLDTEKGFSLERFEQMGGEDWEKHLEHVMVINIKDFKEQYERVNKVIPHVKGFGLIIVDTIGNLYRKDARKDVKAANRLMDRQLRFLFEISKEVPVILTNQVYDKMDSNEKVSVGGNMVLKWCKKIFELNKEPREIVMHKPENKKDSFTIIDSGIVLG